MNENIEPLLSIIVPTKNREVYALCVTKQILSLPYKNIQLILQNNSDTDMLKGMLATYVFDKRFKYNYYNGLLSTIDNFCQAIELCDGEYICAIGDDDGINPDIIPIVEWAKKNDIDAVKPGLQLIYIWPDSGSSLHNDKDTGSFMISQITGNVRISNTKSELQKLMADGGQNNLSRDLVKLYHGIVRKKYLNKIKEITGNYIGGLSPDIYSSIALSSLIKEVVCIDYPLTISGACKQSTSIDTVTGKHTGKLKDAPHFNGHDKYEWASEVPGYYSVETIWADSGLAAVKDMKQYHLLKQFDFTALTARCLRCSPEFTKIIINHYFKYGSSIGISRGKAIVKLEMINLKSMMIKSTFFKYIIMTKSRFLPQPEAKVIYDISDIMEAEKVLKDYLVKNNLSIDKVISDLDDLMQINVN